MDFNKQYVKNEQNEAVVRVFSNHYSHTFEYIKELFEEAKNDFPKLSETEVKVVMLAGSRYNRMTAIQFNVPSNEIPNDYFDWENRVDDLGFCQVY